MGVVNVRTAFNELWTEAEALRKEKEGAGYGYNWWFQAKLGQLVREHGMRVAMEGECEYDAPHFVPKRHKVPRPSPPPAAKCDGEQLVKAATVVKTWTATHKPDTYWYEKGWCARCMSEAKAAGTVKHGDPKMPNGRTVPKPIWMCKCCKRYLCKECNARWDHARNQPPLSEVECSPCTEV